MINITVYDKRGKLLNTCTERVASVLLQRKRAIKIGDASIKLVIDKKDIKIIKKKVIQRDNRICFYCAKAIPIDVIATVDHVIPKTINSNGKCGYDTEENMVCCCLNCNNHKSDMNFDEYIIYRYSILIAYLNVKTNNIEMNIKQR